MPVPVPAIVVHPPRAQREERTGLVGKVTGRAKDTLDTLRRRPVSTPPPAPSHTPSPAHAHRRDRSVSDTTNSGTAASQLLSAADAHHARVRGRRHTIIAPRPVLPPLQLGPPPDELGMRVDRELADRSRIEDQLDRRRFHTLDLGALGIVCSSAVNTEQPPVRYHCRSDDPAPSLTSPSPSSPNSQLDSPQSDSLPVTPRLPSEMLTPMSSHTPSGGTRPHSFMSQRTVHIIRRKPIKRTLVDILDAYCHPHIINNILEHIPAGQLGTLRKVSTGFRDWVDLYLCYHLMIECYGSRGAAHMRIGVSRLVGGEWEVLFGRRLCAEDSIECVPGDLIPPHLLARTGCVELRGPLGCTDVSQLAKRLINLQTVRLSENGIGLFPDACPFSAETIVATLNRDPTKNDHALVDTRWHLPEGIKRLFLNVHFDSPNPVGCVRPFSYPSSVKEVCVRFVDTLPPPFDSGFLHLRPFDLIFQQIGGTLRGDIKYNFIDSVNFGPLWSSPARRKKEPTGVLQRTRRLVGLPDPKKRRTASASSAAGKVIENVTAKAHTRPPQLPGPMYNAARRSAEEALKVLLRQEVARQQQKTRGLKTTPTSASAPQPQSEHDTPETNPLKLVKFLSLDEYRRRVPPQQFVMETLSSRSRPW